MKQYRIPVTEIHAADIQMVMAGSLNLWDETGDGQLSNYGNFEEDIHFGKEKDDENTWDKL